MGVVVLGGKVLGHPLLEALDDLLERTAPRSGQGSHCRIFPSSTPSSSRARRRGRRTRPRRRRGGLGAAAFIAPFGSSRNQSMLVSSRLGGRSPRSPRGGRCRGALARKPPLRRGPHRRCRGRGRSGRKRRHRAKGLRWGRRAGRGGRRRRRLGGRRRRRRAGNRGPGRRAVDRRPGGGRRTGGSGRRFRRLRLQAGGELGEGVGHRHLLLGGRPRRRPGHRRGELEGADELRDAVLLGRPASVPRSRRRSACPRGRAWPAPGSTRSGARRSSTARRAASLPLRPWRTSPPLIWSSTSSAWRIEVVGLAGRTCRGVRAPSRRRLYCRTPRPRRAGPGPARRLGRR